MRYRKEFGPPLDGSPRTIDFFLDTDQTGPATLNWDPIAPPFPDEYQILLIDTVAATSTNMRFATEYTVDVTPGPRPFRIEITFGRPVHADFDVDPNVPMPLSPAQLNDLSIPPIPFGTITGWAWDFQNDGIIDATDQYPVHTFPAMGDHPVRLEVTDDSGNTDAVVKIVPVSYPPFLSLLPQSFNINEGAALRVRGDFVDHVENPFSVRFDWGDGRIETFEVITATGSGSIDRSHVYGDDGSYAFEVCVSDSRGATSCEARTVSVANLPPVVDGGGNQTVAEGDVSVTIAASFVDPGTLDTHSGAFFDWGDGAIEPVALVPGPNGTGSFSGAHIYADSGSYAARGCVTDDEGATGCGGPTITVLNLPPMLEAGPHRTGRIDQPLVLDTSTFTDPGLLDTHTANIDWGDGAVEPGVVVETPGSGSGSVQGSHQYAAVGEYVVSIDLTDDEGATTLDTFVVNMRPGGPDLIVNSVDTSGIVVDPGTLALSGMVAAEIANSGVDPVTGSFTIVFFGDEDGDGVFAGGTDTLFGSTTAGPLPVGATATVGAALDGVARFRDDRVHAFVDADADVAEGDETNNVGASGTDCEFIPPAPGYDIVTKYVSGPGPLYGAPVVANFNDDNGDGAIDELDMPDLLFVPYLNQPLEVISGDDGRRLLQIGSAGEISSLAKNAVGDIDLDGFPEIVVLNAIARRAIVYEHTGERKWVSGTFTGFPNHASHVITLANVVGDGRPEILVGPVVISADGVILADGRNLGGTAGLMGAVNAEAAVADLDLDGVPEIVVGPTAYHFEGGVLKIAWARTDLYGAFSGGRYQGDGHVAIANFDADPFPEIVLLHVTRTGASRELRLLNHDGSNAESWTATPTGTIEGSTNHNLVVADFDGDNQPEIALSTSRGVGGGNVLVDARMIESDGSLRWVKTISLAQSSASAVMEFTAFDFDADGQSELVGITNPGNAASTTANLHIYRGATGGLLLQQQILRQGGGKPTYGPIVADVDNDGHAEIVVPSLGGAQVVAENDARWVGSRPIWNQANYHITNVANDGAIPFVEARHWESDNAWRQNQAIPIAPDLTAALVRVHETATEVIVTARIGNGGAVGVDPGVSVALHDGDPLAGGSALRTGMTSRRLEPGDFEDVQLLLPRALVSSSSLWVVADDTLGLRGRHAECNEANNAVDSGRVLTGLPSSLPDLVVRSVDGSAVTIDPQSLSVSGAASAEIANEGDTPTPGPCTVAFFQDADGNGKLDSGIDDVLGTVDFAALAAGESTSVTANLSGVAYYRDGTIYALVDSAEVIEERDESNNLGRSGGDCEVVPPPGDLDIRLEWSWPTNYVGSQPPLVVDIDGDGIPEVLVTQEINNPGGNDRPGPIRVLDGRDGTLVNTIGTSAEWVRGIASMAAGDIDLDGRPEIVATTCVHAWWATATCGVPQRLIAFEHDGTLKWRSDSYGTGSAGVFGSGPSIADLDGDGVPEIILGHEVYDASGARRWRGVGPYYQRTSHSAVADVNLDGLPEVVAGNVLYSSSGAKLWESGSRSGAAAIGNFDDDPYAEIVLSLLGSSSTTTIRLLEHDGALKWQRAVPGSVPPGSGSLPPTLVADVDGDGEPEIGVIGLTLFSVIETDGSVKWSVPIQENTANTGATAFDFDGDGQVEIVYRGDGYLYVFRGTDGATLFRTPMTALTWEEYPVVADVDADGNAEIVVVGRVDGQAGVYVYGAANDNWVGARRIWNQHTYHVTNVNDDGTIPSLEANSWQIHNSYRQQVQTVGSPFGAPDLSAGFLRITATATEVVLTARIGNSGAVPVGSGLPVSFYDGDPAVGGVLLGSSTLAAALRPGEFDDAVLALPLETSTSSTIWVVADDAGGLAGTHNECDEADNAFDSGLTLGNTGNTPPEALCQDVTVAADDACQAAVTVDVIDAGSFDPDGDEITLAVDPEGPYAEGVTPVTLTATDGSGESDTCQAGVTVSDVEAPLISCPADVELPCGSEVDPALTGTASATDNCALGGTVDFVDSGVPTCGTTSTISRTWTAVDVSGNTASCVQTIAIVDHTAPLLDGVPTDATVGCGAIPAPPVLTATDTCDPDVGVSFEETPNGGSCADGYTLTRTWTAIDNCGNAATHVQSIMVVNTAPVATPDLAATDEDTPLTIAGSVLTANDTDGDGHDLTVVAVLGGVETHGTVALVAGAVTYTPDPNFHGLATFSYEIDDGNSGSDSSIVTVTVLPVNDPPNVSADPDSQSVQYSDPIVGVTFTGTDIDSLSLAITTEWTRNGGAAQAGLPAGLSLSAADCVVGVPPVSCTWIVAGNIQEGPGAYDVTGSVVDDQVDAPQPGASATFSIAVEQEDARSFYTGPSLIWTPSVDEGNATVTLMATIQDITSATTDPSTDPHAGDIRNATVTFKDETGQELCTAPQIDLVFAGDSTLGSASCDWTVTLSNNEDARPIEVTVVVDHYYLDTSDNETVIIVAKPGEGFITGGGYLLLSDSAGMYTGGVGTKSNYGFNVRAKVLNNGKVQLRGRTTIIVQSADGRKYKITSNALLSLGVDLDPDGDGDVEAEPYAAQFESKANLTDVTDPLNPLALGGNLLLQMRLTDNGEPGENDTIGFTLWDDGALLFSSHWDGAQSVEQSVGGGNLQVH